MVDVSKGIRALTLEESASVVTQYGNEGRLLSADVWEFNTPKVVYIIWCNEVGNAIKGIGIRKSTLECLPETLAGMKCKCVGGKRGWYSNNNCPESLINYHILHNGVRQCDIDGEIPDASVNTVWYNLQHNVGLFVALTKYRDDFNVMVEFYMVDGIEGTCKKVCHFPYRILYAQLTGKMV